MAVVNTVYTTKVTSANTNISLVPSAPDFILSSLIIVNKEGSAEALINISLCDANGTELANISGTNLKVPVGEPVTMDVKSLSIPKQSYQLMVKSSVTGVHFTASGGVVS